jgi:flagellar export protein FliJ
MKSREAVLRLRRYELDERSRTVADLESMIRDFETMAGDLERQVAMEEDRTGVKDPKHFAYSTFAKAVAQRRDNLRVSVADLRAKLESARQEHDEALANLSKAEAVDGRDQDRPRRSGSGSDRGSSLPVG